MTSMIQHVAKHALAAFCFLGALGAAGACAAGASPTVSPGSAAVSLREAVAHPRVDGIDADIRLLRHTMLGVAGKRVPATSLLLVPRTAPPAGGWPLVAWEHGTSTPGQKTCAPSLTPELDGGLTRDGFKSDYVWQIAQFIEAGYAVVAPDLEGIGPDAASPYPYYDLSSLARSVVASVAAARLAEPKLAARWAVVGHSDGGHGALGVEAYAHEAAGTQFVGTVASAPYVAVAAHAASFGSAAAAASNQDAALQNLMMQQFQGALMSTGLAVVRPSFDPLSVMGPDLAATLPTFRTLCSVKAIATIDAAVKARGREFSGLKPGWERQPAMRAFLAANDPMAIPGFRLRKPVLVLQGGADTFVLESLQTKFVERLQGGSTPVTYLRYPDADHFSILHAANADVLRFLRQRFAP